MSRLMRWVGKQDKQDVNSYKRFRNHPKTDCNHILFKGDSRTPAEIQQNGGFFPRKSNTGGTVRSGVTIGGINSGASSGMVCLTLEPGVAAFYALTKYGGHFWGGRSKGNQYPYVYVVFLPSGKGIANYKAAEMHGSENIKSMEVSTLAVPYCHVIGWRRLPEFNTVPGKRPITVDFSEDFQENQNCTAPFEKIPTQDREWLSHLVGFSDIYVPNTV